MPYIKEERRKELLLGIGTPKTPGELNYFITHVIFDYLGGREESYQAYNDIIGVLSCCQQEIYRRLVVPYEEKKKTENGDVFK